MLHVTNGDCAADRIREALPGADVLPWGDVLHEGPVPGSCTEAHLLAIRARFLEECGAPDAASIIREFAARNTRLLEANEVTLWFEHDLYDQLQLIQILALRSVRREGVSLINPALFLGELTAEQLRGLWPQRQPVDDAAFDAASGAWRAFRADSLEPLRQFVLGEPGDPLPHLRAALRRLLAEVPDECTGLSRTETLILRAVEAGAKSFADLFENVRALEEAPFHGDLTLRRHVDRILRYPKPPLTGEPYEVTLLGRAALRGETNLLDHNPTERWIGGTFWRHTPPPPPETLEEQIAKMRRDWDSRARANARYFVATGAEDWEHEDFYAYGERTVAEHVLSDMVNICQGRDPKSMRVIEIGCGAGRVTRALAAVFGEVHAVDISPEMVAHAREAAADRPNVHVYANNGMDLTVLPPGPYDFAFSTIVFQHIPSREVIRSYVREVHRILRPGALFKFQIQGDTKLESSPGNTWVGVAWTDEEVVALAHECGFEPRFRHGAGDQYFWLWFFRI